VRSLLLRSPRLEGEAFARYGLANLDLAAVSFPHPHSLHMCASHIRLQVFSTFVQPALVSLPILRLESSSAFLQPARVRLFVFHFFAFLELTHVGVICVFRIGDILSLT